MWYIVLYVHGFHSMAEAKRFEYQWQHPTRTHALRAWWRNPRSIGSPKTLSGQVRLLATLLRALAWRPAGGSFLTAHFVRDAWHPVGRARDVLSRTLFEAVEVVLGNYTYTTIEQFGAVLPPAPGAANMAIVDLVEDDDE